MAANFLGRLQTFLFGAAIGRAASDSVTPVLEPVRQHAWFKNQNKVLDPGTAAEAVTQGIITEDEAHFDAERSGFADNRFGVLWRLAQRVPGVAEARELHRRTKADGSARVITLDQLHHVYAKSQIEPQFWDGLDALLHDILSPGELAAAIHRGLVPNPDILLGEQPSGPRKVESYPVQPIDAVAEALGSGYNKERLAVLVGLQGLPMGTHEAAEAFFRGIITHGDYIAAFNESNSRNEWAQAVLDYTRQIPTARDFFENALRGHHDFDWAAKQAERHGMSRDDSFLIYQNQGRPLNLHQITQALAWGAKYNPGQGDDPDPWMQSVLLGPVRPEFYDMQDKLKYNLPSAFYFRALQEQDVVSEAEAAVWYRRLGWPPELADLVAHAYAKPEAAAKLSPYVGKAQTQLWTEAHKSFVKLGTPRSVIEPVLTTLVPVLGDRDAIFQLWTDEKALAAGVPPGGP